MARIFQMNPGNCLTQRAAKPITHKAKAEKLQPVYIDPETKDLLDEYQSMTKVSIAMVVREMAEAYGLKKKTARLHKERGTELDRTGER